jgi:hypothetical protein
MRNERKTLVLGTVGGLGFGAGGALAAEAGIDPFPRRAELDVHPRDQGSHHEEQGQTVQLLDLRPAEA